MAIIQSFKRIALPLVCLGLIGAPASTLGATPQITQPVDNAQRVSLKGNVRPRPVGTRDLGAVDAALPAQRILLLLKRSVEQQDALAQYIAEANTPGGPLYQHWLTPAQLGLQYGPAESDVQTVVAWLRSQGFAVAKVSQARTTIEFSGTAGQVQSAFATQLHTFTLNGETHVANIGDPQIPAALAPVVAGISPLNDYHPRAMHTAPVAGSLVYAPTGANPHALQSVARNSSRSALSIRPSYTDNTNGVLMVTPGDFATIYDTPTTLNTKPSGSTSLSGSGVTIGIAGDSNVDLSNVANYRALFGLPAVVPTVTIDGSDPGTGTDDELEALLDLEVASAVAPSANLTLYTAQDTTFQSGLYLAIQRALDDNAIAILNVSFGQCEAYLGQSGNAVLNNFWQQAAAQGISVTVSTGDSGSAGCDNENTQTTAYEGLQVSGFASTPYNIAVGGTDFQQDSTNYTQYWNLTNTSVGESAVGYIPEIPWDDSSSNQTTISANVPFQDQNGNTNIVAAGGGVSGCQTPTFTSSGNDIQSCAGAYALPAFQSGYVTGQTARTLPDVSLFASNGFNFSSWLVCASGIGSDQAGTQDCTTPPAGAIQAGTYTNYQGVGGTSASSPAFAGVLALALQQLRTTQGNTAARLGQADYTLYKLAKQFPASFHDVTTGNNSVDCSATGSNTLGTQQCGSNSFLTGYDVAGGYDLASGIGSVDATKLIANWSSVTSTPSTTTLQLNGSTSPLTITHGTSVNVTATVAGSGGTPTGSIVLVNNSTLPGSQVAAAQGTTASPALFPLTNGSATGTDAFLPGGSYTVQANYGGDVTFAPSVSTPGISVKVNPEASTLLLNLEAFEYPAGTGIDASNASISSLPYGTWISVNAQPISTAQANASSQAAYYGQATGSVQFTSSASILNVNVPINSNGVAEIPGTTALAYPPGTYTVSASYPGDPSFNASTAAAQTFVIVKNTPSITGANGSTSGTVTVEVDPSSPNLSGAGQLYLNNGIALPTGTVTLTNSSGATVGSGALTNVNTSNGLAAQATITVTGTAANISYPGDANYNAGTAAFNGGGGSTAFTLSSAPSSLTIAQGSSKTTTVNITPVGGFTGTVTLTCAVAPATGSAPPTCGLANSTVTVSGSSAVADTLTVNTTAASSAIRTASNAPDRRWYAAGGAALAGLLLIGLPGRRRAWQRLLSVLILMVGIGVVGCGGGSSSGGGGTGTPAGSYTVTVTAISGSVAQTSSVQVTVQ